MCVLSGAYMFVLAGSSIYCDTLSVSQYDSKVRSDLIRERSNSLSLSINSLNNLFSSLSLDFDYWYFMMKIEHLCSRMRRKAVMYWLSCAVFAQRDLKNLNL